MSLIITLRNYQNKMVAGFRDAFSKGYWAILGVLPTGGGKTVVFTFMSQRMNLNGKKVIIMVHRVELLRQTCKALSEFGVEHGMVNPQYTPNMKLSVQVASIQTILNRLNYFASACWHADVLIIDEAHHANSKSWLKVINFFKTLNPDLKIIGVTATPERGDGQGLGEESGGVFQTIVEGPQISWLQDEGFLVRARVFGWDKKLDLSDVHSVAGDYNKTELSSLVNKPKIIGDAVDHYRDVCNGVPAIVFCVSVSHAENSAQQFRDAGYRFHSIDGSMDDDTRKKLIHGLKKGTIQGLTSCDLISEGTDIPRATCAVELRPTKSSGLNTQQRGRVLRPVYAPGYDLETREGRLAAIAASEKPFAYILDHVNNTERHGLPHWDKTYSLEGSKKKRGSKNQEAAVRVVMCDSCYVQQEPTSVCVVCGHVMKPPKDNTPKQVEGKLTEITDEMARQRKAAIPKSNGIEDLLKVAEKRGYKPEWAHHINMAREKKLERLAKLMPIELPPMPKVANSEFMDDLNF